MCSLKAPLDSINLEEGIVLNIDKPAGITSFGVVKKVRRWSGFKKVGHAGTLDPLATGVLVILLGKATKRSDEFMNKPKEYEATIEFGKQSNTDDREGEICNITDVPAFTLTDIKAVVEKYIGEIQQIPPMFSALRKDGKRLYKLARKGITIERDPRPVSVYNITIESWDNPLLKVIVQCGRGTYIRALARDIGHELKVGGILTSLVRTEVGEYRLEDAWQLNELEQALKNI